MSSLSSISSFSIQVLNSLTHKGKFFSTFPASYLFAGISGLTSSPTLKNLLSIAFSTFYLVGLHGFWACVRTLLASSIGAYAIARYLQGPWMPWIGFVLVMSHLSFTHLYPTFGGGLGGVQMVLAIKLTSFCWNVYDGRRPARELSPRQKELALPTVPPLLDYSGYVLFFPTLFVGPAFDFAEYKHWLLRGQHTGADQVRMTAMKAAYGVAWNFASTKVASTYSSWILLSYQAMHRPIWRRIWHLYILAFSKRMKFYGYWSLTEGACVLCGISYNGMDKQTGRAKWDRMENARPLKLEFAQAGDIYVRNWNIRTHMWLRDCIYLRFACHTSQFFARVVSFIVSALLHGFNPGHHASFVAAAVCQTFGKEARRWIRPHFLGTDGRPLPCKRYYDLLTWFLVQLTIAYITIPFIYPNTPMSLVALKRTFLITG